MRHATITAEFRSGDFYSTTATAIFRQQRVAALLAKAGPSLITCIAVGADVLIGGAVPPIIPQTAAMRLRPAVMLPALLMRCIAAIVMPPAQQIFKETHLMLLHG
nr:hypothetical protein [Collimonas arenae]